METRDAQVIVAPSPTHPSANSEAPVIPASDVEPEKRGKKEKKGKHSGASASSSSVKRSDSSKSKHRSRRSEGEFGEPHGDETSQRGSAAFALNSESPERVPVHPHLVTSTVGSVQGTGSFVYKSLVEASRSQQLEYHHQRAAGYQAATSGSATPQQSRELSPPPPPLHPGAPAAEPPAPQLISSGQFDFGRYHVHAQNNQPTVYAPQSNQQPSASPVMSLYPGMHNEMLGASSPPGPGLLRMSSPSQVNQSAVVDVPRQSAEMRRVLGEEIRFGGNNIVLCNGAIVLGPNLGQLCFSIAALTVPIVLSEVFLRNSIPRWLEVIDIVFYAFTILALLKTATTNPGIVSKRTEHADVEMQKDYIGANERRLEVKYCYTCHIYKAPRTMHCRICNNCVDQFDHHCPWTSTDIGAGNYHYFLYFLHMVNLSALAMMLTVTWAPLQESADFRVSVIDALSRLYWIPIALTVYVFILGNGVAGLMFYHYFLITVGQTTAEHLRKTYFEEGKNPFHLGCCANWYAKCTGWVDTEVFSAMYRRVLFEELQRAEERRKKMGFAF